MFTFQIKGEGRMHSVKQIKHVCRPFFLFLFFASVTNKLATSVLIRPRFVKYQK